jgi:hypothetical protein
MTVSIRFSGFANRARTVSIAFAVRMTVSFAFRFREPRQDGEHSLFRIRKPLQDGEHSLLRIREPLQDGEHRFAVRMTGSFAFRIRDPLQDGEHRFAVRMTVSFRFSGFAIRSRTASTASRLA